MVFNVVSYTVSSYPKDSGTEKINVSELGFVLFGDEVVDIRVFNHLSKSQICTIVLIMRKIANMQQKGKEVDLNSLTDKIFNSITENGLDYLSDSFFNLGRWLELPQKIDIHLVMNRMKNIQYKYVLKERII